MLGLQQMFEVTAARFHAVTQTFAPLIDSLVDDTLLQTGPLGNQTSLQIVPIESKRKKVKIILRRDRDISKDLSCKYRPMMQDLVEATHTAITKAI